MTEPTLQDKIKASFQLREQMADLNSQIDELKKQKTELDTSIMDILKSLGVDSTRTDVGSVRLSKEDVYTVKDWDAFGKYVVENNMLFLMQRRLSTAVLREALDNGAEVPGIEVFEKESLGMTKR